MVTVRVFQFLDFSNVMPLGFVHDALVNTLAGSWHRGLMLWREIGWWLQCAKKLIVFPSSRWRSTSSCSLLPLGIVIASGSQTLADLSM